jgi:uncharacterized protein YegL
MKKIIKKKAAKVIPVNPIAQKLKASKIKTGGKKPIKVGKTYIALILDASGSMASIKGETINHFNEQIEQIAKDSVGLDTSVSLTTFNGEVDVKFFDSPVDSLKPLTLKTYAPGGYTSLYDAVGTTVDRLLAECKDIKKKDTAVLIVILSDGQENSSQKYNVGDIAERIQELQNTKRWTFTYLGANQDLSKIAQQLHIPAGNISAFTADAIGMVAATNLSVGSSQSYMDSRREGTTQTIGYYSPNK